MSYYGSKPKIVVCHQNVDFTELEAKLYLPIRVRDRDLLPNYINNAIKSIEDIWPRLTIPKNLMPFKPLILTAIFSECGLKGGFSWIEDTNIYLSVKRQFVQSGYSGNRPGWHCDGFGTKDINWIWSDTQPTKFCFHKFKDVSLDDVQSMRDIENQIERQELSTTTYPDNTLVRLDPFVVHNVPDIKEPGFRTFFKLSFSNYRYNLVGNSHNHEIAYKWHMYSREELRNQPDTAERDYVI